MQILRFWVSGVPELLPLLLLLLLLLLRALGYLADSRWSSPKYENAEKQQKLRFL